MPLNYDFTIAPGPGGESRALFRDPATVAALRAAPPAVRAFLAESGFGQEAAGQGAPPGSYWASEEGARLEIMERMSEALERHRLPKPGEVPEGGFNLSHLFGAIMAARPVPDPTAAPPTAAAPPPTAAAAPAARPAPPHAAAAAPGAAPRPARPVADDPGLAGLRAGPTRPDAPAEAAAGAGGMAPVAVPRAAGPGSATGDAPDPGAAGRRSSAAAAAEAVGEAVGEVAGAGPGDPRPGLGRLRGVLMLLVGIALLGYALLSLL
ncbi:MAG: hypothetical protein N2Z62_03945 [Rhodobacteraceae bacterium]|nr:hypothetical protein [Paracoccaceae bacterium]